MVFALISGGMPRRRRQRSGRGVPLSPVDHGRSPVSKLKLRVGGSATLQNLSWWVALAPRQDAANPGVDATQAHPTDLRSAHQLPRQAPAGDNGDEPGCARSARLLSER